MFDISWSELLILGVVTLIFVGPKELPVFLRTIGRYAGVLKRHAAEFRAQFDEAMREAELDQLKQEIQTVRDDLHRTVTDAERSVQGEVEAARRELEKPLSGEKSEQGARAEEPEEYPLPMIPPEVALAHTPEPPAAPKAANGADAAAPGGEEKADPAQPGARGQGA